MRMNVALMDVEGKELDFLRVAVKPDGSLDITRDRRPVSENSVMYRSFTEGRDYLYHEGDPDIEQYEDLRDWYKEGEKTTLVPMQAAADAGSRACRR
jgi:hypothetical protein